MEGDHEMIELKPDARADDYTADTSFALSVSGVPDMRSFNSGSGRCFKPVRLRLTYRYSSEFGQWALDMWNVSGPMRLKSGETSDKQRGQQYGWSFGDGQPQWVADAIERYRPTGIITFQHVTLKDVNDA